MTDRKSRGLTEGIRDTVAIALGVLHVLLRCDQEVVHELGRLGVLEMDVLFLAHRLHEVLVNQLTNLSPLITILHQEQMIPLSDEIPDIGDWTMAVQTTFLVQQFSDHVGIRDNESSVGEPLQCVDAAISLGPFGESGNESVSAVKFRDYSEH